MSRPNFGKTTTSGRMGKWNNYRPTLCINNTTGERGGGQDMSKSTCGWKMGGKRCVGAHGHTTNTICAAIHSSSEHSCGCPEKFCRTVSNNTLKIKRAKDLPFIYLWCMSFQMHLRHNMNYEDGLPESLHVFLLIQISYNVPTFLSSKRRVQ